MSQSNAVEPIPPDHTPLTQSHEAVSNGLDPLTIGAPFVTADCIDADVGEITVYQSPNNRGSLCHRWEDATYRIQSFGINPLTIGAPFVTKPFSGNPVTSPRYQSPNNRGSLCHLPRTSGSAFTRFKYQSPNNRGSLCHREENTLDASS